MVPGRELHNFRSSVGKHSSPEEEEDDGEGELSNQIETLPLFPIPGSATPAGSGFMMKESVSSEHGNGVGYYSGGNWFRSDTRTSLELSLNSYGYYG